MTTYASTIQDIKISFRADHTAVNLSLSDAKCVSKYVNTYLEALEDASLPDPRDYS
jgi:hypothetical protein